jgi:hypothetical protein
MSVRGIPLRARHLELRDEVEQAQSTDEVAVQLQANGADEGSDKGAFDYGI